MASVEKDIAHGLKMMRREDQRIGKAADVLEELAHDDSVTPYVYDRVCDAVFSVLDAYHDARKRRWRR